MRAMRAKTVLMLIMAVAAVGPGVTALQRILSFAYRSATRRDRDRTAAFVTE